MTDFTPRIGGTLSADIAVPEHERVLRFYSRVLSTGENPLWQEDLMNNLGMPIIGLGQRTPEYEQLPLQWMPHIQVADVDASVARALELDGQKLMHAEGQWAVLADPNGVAFGIIPLVSADAMPPVEGDGPFGHIAWLDLTVADAPATRDFYCEVIGWTVEEVPMSDGGDSYADYSMVAADGEGSAGICHARGTNDGVPSVWMLYLPVGDIEESLRRVEQEGGKVLRKSSRADGSTACAVIQDPVGACLSIAPV